MCWPQAESRTLSHDAFLGMCRPQGLQTATQALSHDAFGAMFGPGVEPTTFWFRAKRPGHEANE
jgi:hypothetical protein